MFVRYFAYIPSGREKVERRLLSEASAWLPFLVEAAFAEGEEIRIRMSLGKDLRLSKRAVVKLGEPLRMDERSLLPIDIEAANMRSLFPVLQGELEIAPLGSEMTKLTLSGTYQAPLGLAGALIDRALLHHVAEAVVKNFVERVAGVLQEENTDGTPTVGLSDWLRAR